jgi:hypothetical protein
MVVGRMSSGAVGCEVTVGGNGRSGEVEWGSRDLRKVSSDENGI